MNDPFDFGAVCAEKGDREFAYFLLQFCMPGKKLILTSIVGHDLLAIGLGSGLFFYRVPIG